LAIGGCGSPTPKRRSLAALAHLIGRTGRKKVAPIAIPDPLLR